MTFTKNQIAQLKEVKRLFPSVEIVVYHATADQVRQIKDAGLSGISRNQKKD